MKNIHQLFEIQINIFNLEQELKKKKNRNDIFDSTLFLVGGTRTIKWNNYIYT